MSETKSIQRKSSWSRLVLYRSSAKANASKLNAMAANGHGETGPLGG